MLVMASKTRQIRVRFTAIFTSCAVLIQLLGMGSVQVFCAMSDTVGDRCCCPEKAQTPTPDSPTIKSAPCCKELQPTNRVQDRLFELASQDIPTPQWVAVQIQRPLNPPPIVSTPAALSCSARDPPPDYSPEIFVQNCSYLI